MGIKLSVQLQNDRMISIWVQAKPIIIIVIHIYAPNLNTQETEFKLQMTSRYNIKK